MAKKKQTNNLPFASEPAETMYQVGIESGVKFTRNQCRKMLIAFTHAQEESKKSYEAFQRKRAAEIAAKWHPRSKKPSKPGVYRTSNAYIVNLGGARGYWDGKKWLQHEGWANYAAGSNLVWLGDGPNGTDPIRE